MKTLVGTPDKPSEELGAKFYIDPSGHTPLAREHMAELSLSDGETFIIFEGNIGHTIDQDEYGSYWRDPYMPEAIPSDNSFTPEFFEHLSLRQVTVLKESIFSHPAGRPLFKEGHYRLEDGTICVLRKMSHTCEKGCATPEQGAVCQKYFWQVEAKTLTGIFDICDKIENYKLTEPYRPLHYGC